MQSHGATLLARKVADTEHGYVPKFVSKARRPCRFGLHFAELQDSISIYDIIYFDVLVVCLYVMDINIVS